MKAQLISILFLLSAVIAQANDNVPLSPRLFDPAKSLKVYEDGTQLFFIESYAYQTNPVYLVGYTPYRFVIVKYPGDPHYTYGVIRACNNRVGSSRDASSDFAPSCPIQWHRFAD